MLLTRICLEDEVGSPLDGGEVRGRLEPRADVVHLVPEVHGHRVVHLGQVHGVEVAAVRRPGTWAELLPLNGQKFEEGNTKLGDFFLAHTCQKVHFKT